MRRKTWLKEGQVSKFFLISRSLPRKDQYRLLKMEQCPRSVQRRSPICRSRIQPRLAAVTWSSQVWVFLRLILSKIECSVPKTDSCSNHMNPLSKAVLPTTHLHSSLQLCMQQSTRINLNRSSTSSRRAGWTLSSARHMSRSCTQLVTHTSATN